MDKIKELENRIEALEMQVSGLMSLAGIYNRIVKNKVDDSIGQDLVDIHKALIRKGARI